MLIGAIFLMQFVCWCCFRITTIVQACHYVTLEPQAFTSCGKKTWPCYSWENTAPILPTDGKSKHKVSSGWKQKHQWNEAHPTQWLNKQSRQKPWAPQWQFGPIWRHGSTFLIREVVKGPLLSPCARRNQMLARVLKWNVFKHS